MLSARARHPGDPQLPLASQPLPRPNQHRTDAPGGSQHFLTVARVSRTCQGSHRVSRRPLHRPRPAGQALSSGRGLHPQGPVAGVWTLREKPQGPLNGQRVHGGASSRDRPGATWLVDLTNPNPNPNPTLIIFSDAVLALIRRMIVELCVSRHRGIEAAEMEGPTARDMGFFSHSPGGQRPEPRGQQGHPHAEAPGKVRPPLAQLLGCEGSLSCGHISPASASTLTGRLRFHPCLSSGCLTLPLLSLVRTPVTASKAQLDNPRPSLLQILNWIPSSETLVSNKFRTWTQSFKGHHSIH